MPTLMNPVKTCRHETLAAGPCAQIQRCKECGTLSIHIGATTVRLAPEACESLWATLSEALMALSRVELSEPAPGAKPPIGARGLS